MKIGGLGGSFGGLGAGKGVSLLPVGSSVALLGDSMFARAASFTTGAARTTAENRCNSELMWSHFRSPRFVHRNWWDPTTIAANRVPTYGASMAADNLWSGLNFGYSGDTATGSGLRVEQVIESGADVCVVNDGTNIGTTDSLASTTITAIQDAIERLVDGGVRVVRGTIRPRRVSETPTGSEISPASMTRIRDINDSIRANWSAWGASALWDPWEALRDPQYNEAHVLYGTILPAYAISDGVHLSPRGAHVSSLSLDAALAKVIASGTWFNTDPSIDNIISSIGAMSGSGGTVGGGCSGQIPTGWTIQNTTGGGQPVTCACSVADGELTLTFTSTGAGAANTFNTIRLNPTTAPTTGFISTDYVTALHEVEVVTPGSVLVMLQSTLGQVSTISARGHGQTTSAFNNEPSPAIDTALAGWLATEPLLIESRTSLNPRLDFSIRQDVAGSAVAKVKTAALKVVPSPETAFPWVA